MAAFVRLPIVAADAVNTPSPTLSSAAAVRVRLAWRGLRRGELRSCVHRVGMRALSVAVPCSRDPCAMVAALSAHRAWMKLVLTS